MRDALSSAHCDHGAERDGFATARDDQAEPRRDHGAERDGFAAVRAEGLVCRYGRETVFRDVSFAIWPGDFAVIIGANGAGKSTLLKIVLGEMTPDAGSVNVFGMTPRARGARALAVAHPLRQRGEVGRRGADSRARAHACPRPSPAAGDSLHEKNEGNRCREVRIGYLSQHGMSGGGAFPATGWEVVLSSMYADIGPVLPARARHRARAREALALVGAEEWAKKPLEELSGGQLQRIMVARALAPSPDLLLLDEPTTGVDQETSAAIIGLLARLSRDSGMTTAMVTHDVASVAASATRVFCLEHGTLVELGKSQVESELTHKHKHPMRQAATVKTDARELMRGSGAKWNR